MCFGSLPSYLLKVLVPSWDYFGHCRANFGPFGACLGNILGHFDDILTPHWGRFWAWSLHNARGLKCVLVYDLACHFSFRKFSAALTQIHSKSLVFTMVFAYATIFACAAVCPFFCVFCVLLRTTTLFRI